MSPTRRDFMQRLGIALAALALTDCLPPPGSGGTARGRLRQCWLKLDWLAEQSGQGDEQGQQAEQELTAQHRAALDELVAAGALEARVADQVQTVFAATARHIRTYRTTEVTEHGAVALVTTCYAEMIILKDGSRPPPSPPPESTAEDELASYIADSAGRLAQQAERLAELAESGQLDPDSVAQAQAAIEREMAFVAISDTQMQVLVQHMIEMTTATTNGSLVTYLFPDPDALDLDIPPDTAAAARFLAELLLEK